MPTVLIACLVHLKGNCSFTCFLQQESSEDSFDQDQVETAKENVSQMLSELQRELQPKIEPTILITEASDVPDDEIDTNKKDLDSMPITVEIPQVTISAEDESSSIAG